MKTPTGKSSGECSSALITATLGVPSQHCSNTRSFADSPPASIEHPTFVKGDTEETIALLRALRLSEKEAQLRIEGKSVSDENQMFKFDDQFSSTESEDETDCDVGSKISVGEEVSLTTSITKSSEAETACDVETENSSKMTPVHLTSSETNLESTKNDDSISEIPLKSEAVTFLSPGSLIGIFLNELASKCIWRYVTFKVSYSKLLIAFPVPSGRSQDDETESPVGQSSSEKTDTNELTPEEGKFVHSIISIVHRDNSLHNL